MLCGVGRKTLNGVLGLLLCRNVEVVVKGHTHIEECPLSHWIHQPHRALIKLLGGIGWD